jgi:uncharacterized protein (TIGR03083 family)
MNDRDILRELWAEWLERGESLASDDWSTPTRLPGWTVKDLFAHAVPEISAFDVLFESPPANAVPVASGTELLRIFNAPGGVAEVFAPTIADQATQIAHATSTDDLLDRLRGVLDPVFLERTDEVSDDQVIAHPAVGSVTFRTLLEVAVVEQTVHLLDLVDAVGGPALPPAALRRTCEILADIPDPKAVIELATGRSIRSPFPVMR